MKNLLIFLLLIFSLNLFSQTKIDNLKADLANAEGENEIELLNSLAKEYWAISNETSQEYANKALELAENANYKRGIADATFNLGLVYVRFSELEKSQVLFTRSLKIAEKIKYKKGIGNALNGLGFIYNNHSDYNMALEYYQRSLEVFKEADEKKGIAISLGYLGNLYWNLDNYDKSIEYYLKALIIMEEIGDAKGIAQSVNGIGIIYWKLGNYEKALEYYQWSLKINEKLESEIGIANALNNIGIVYHSKQNYNKALEYYTKSLKMVEQTGNKIMISNHLNNLGTLHQEMEQYNKALEYYKKSMKIYREVGNMYGVAASLCNIGGLYVKMQNLTEAVSFIERGIDLAKEIQAKDLIKDSFKNLSQLYEEKSNYKKSLEYFKLYTEVKDSIFTEESSGKIAEMQTKYETEKKEKENEILKKDNKIQKLEINKQQNLRNSFIVISVLVLILAFVIYARYRSKHKINIILNQKNTVIENANSELNQKNKQITKQKNQLSETLDELRETQKMLTDTAHRAGMAEIATGILHNVGNVLNSVKVSSQILKEKIKSSKVNNLQKVLALMEEHTDNLGEFVTSDEKGKMLPEYLLKVGTTLKDEQDNSLKELSNLHRGINHIEEIIAVQQSYAGVMGLVEKVALSTMMDDVLKMHSEMFRKYKIKISKKYSKTIPILIEKGKLIQVFVNLLKNAKESLEAKDEKDRCITIDISEDNQYQTVEITDNGAGISKENLTKIFSYGFSTKKDGKGFGLHTSALAMTELKGKLFAESDGKEKGTKFIMQVPIKKERSNHEKN